MHLINISFSNLNIQPDADIFCVDNIGISFLAYFFLFPLKRSFKNIGVMLCFDYNSLLLIH